MIDYDKEIAEILDPFWKKDFVKKVKWFNIKVGIYVSENYKIYYKGDSWCSS